MAHSTTNWSAGLSGGAAASGVTWLGFCTGSPFDKADRLTDLGCRASPTSLRAGRRGPGSYPNTTASMKGTFATAYPHAVPSSERPPLTGLVLAGGRSRRMGRDKATIEVGGEPLVVRVARRLEPVCQRILIASGDGRRLGNVAWAQIADARPGSGPLAGIVAGLECAGTPLVAVVAVDLPDADPRVLDQLARLWQGEAAIVPLVGERAQPLHGVYATAHATAFRRLLQAGMRGVTHVLSTLGARVVGPEGWGELDPDGAFARNLNRPEDLPP